MRCRSFVMIVLMIQVFLPSFCSSSWSITAQAKTQVLEPVEGIESHLSISDSIPIFEDDFVSSPAGFNTSQWILESYGQGSTAWVGREYFNMTARRHSFRALVSQRTFAVGHSVNIRMKMNQEETVLCVGWTNHTARTGWNYLFGSNSVFFECGISSVLLETCDNDSIRRKKLLPGIDPSLFHDYRLVWNDTVLLAYVDGMRLGVIAADMPAGPFHFKVALTEYRNMTTTGSVLIDKISISQHKSMITENPPFLVLNSPGNNTPNLCNDEVSISAIGSDGTVIYNWDGAQNETTITPARLEMPASEGLHVLNVFSRDGFGYDNWASQRYVFDIHGEAPEIGISHIGHQPAIDGVCSSQEWPDRIRHLIELYRCDGYNLEIPVYIAHDGAFLYFGIDSPIPDGHDSRAAVILTGHLGKHFIGSNTSPVMSVIYNKGAPSAWGGYDELCYLNETTDGFCPWRKLEPQPPGFSYASGITEQGVWYEFRMPLEEFEVNSGEIVGIGVALFPSGMSVHHLSYPMLESWGDASHLAHGYLATAFMIPHTFIIGLGLITIVSMVYVFWRRGFASSASKLNAMEQRIVEIVRSYDEISISRLAHMANTDYEIARQTIFNLIKRKHVSAVVSDDGELVKRI